MWISTRIVRTIPSTLAALLVMAVLWMPTPASAGRHDAGWTEYCPYVFTSHDDPIFFPGQKGAAPAHDFFGNWHTDANSTFASLRAAPADTSCLANPYDDSAYWTPTLMMNGSPVQPKTMFQYYWAPPGNSYQDVQPTPPGLKMYGDRFWWTCGGGGSLGPLGGVRAPRKKAPFDCSPWPGSKVTAMVFLPNCWDGTNLDSQDHKSHMAYPDPKLGCPADHSHVLVGLYVGINWYLTNGTGATLSTGDISTMRAMFFDGWDPAEMQRLIGACMNNGRWCGAWTHSGQDKPPVIKAAQVLPSAVHETDTPLAVPVNAHDPDGDPFTLHYQWQANGTDVGTDSSTLDNHLFAPGDVLTVTITATDDHGNTSLPVVSKPMPVWYDVVAPKPGKPGGGLPNVHGGGFAPRESVPLHLDSPTGTVLATVQTDVFGMFPDTDIQLPQDISAGQHWLYGVGGHVVGNGPFTVTAKGQGPSVAVPQNSPPQIQAVLIDGTPFTNSTFTGVAHGVKDPDGDPVTLHYMWTVNGKKAGGDTSTFSATYLTAGDVIDLSIRPEDNHGNWGDSVGANSPITTKWEIDAPPARPTETSHPVDLSNFAPFEDVELHMDSPSGQLVDTIGVNANGNAFNQQVPMPWPLPGGAHVLYGVGKTSGIVGQGPITVTGIAFAVPGLLHVGDPTVISASGFKPGETVTASFPHSRGVSEVADGTGTVSIDMTMPEEPFPGGDITVNAPSGSTTAPFKTWSSMTFTTNVARPQDRVPFTLHGYGASETVQASLNGVVTQTFTTYPNGSLNGTLVMDSFFGKIRIVMTGLTSGEQHNWKINLVPYVDVTPNPAHPGDTLTITSLYGWPPGDAMYLYWGKNAVQSLNPDSQGSIRTTYVVPAGQKPGIVVLKLFDTTLGKYATCKVTIIS